MRSGAVVAFIVAGVSASCARPTPAIYQAAWDGEATQWEAPPARVVTGADAATGSTAGGAPGGVGNLPVCSKAGQLACCYDDKPGHPVGTPKCGWRQLAPGESVAITAVFAEDVKTTLPLAVTLTNVSPPAFGTYEDCLKAPIGFILSGPGIKAGALGGNIEHYQLKSGGAWMGQGGGGQVGLVAGRDTAAGSGDGGLSMPTYTLSEGLCSALMAPGVTASVALFDQIDFQVGGISYRADFRQYANAGASAFYVVINKGF